MLLKNNIDSKLEIFEIFILRILSCVLVFYIISFSMLHFLNIDIFEVFYLFILGYIIFIFSIKPINYIILKFLTASDFVKMFFLYILLLMSVAIFNVIETYASYLLSGLSNNFIAGIVSGLFVVSLTGIFTQNLSLNLRNKQKLKHVEMLLKPGYLNEYDASYVLEVLKSLTNNFHAESQYLLGRIYQKGMPPHISKNLEEAKKLFAMAARSGHRKARSAYDEIPDFSFSREKEEVSVDKRYNPPTDYGKI